MALIKQVDNFQANFGVVFRTSAIFWVPPLDLARTSLLLSNYWRFKNKINDVAVVISYRTLKGGLLSREVVKFNSADVLVLNPVDEILEEGGSAEIEVISSQELRIPYAAIMVAYEAKSSLSMVHSYSRIYSSYELEERKTITDGHEGCWTLRDDENVGSFCVFHNGRTHQAPQKLVLNVRNYKRECMSAEVSLPMLRPHETVMLKPANYFDDLVGFLGGNSGSASLDFKLEGAFTRMLLGWLSKRGDQLQVTHSNFNYSIHETDHVPDKEAAVHSAIMRVPTAPFETCAVVYPDYDPGEYSLKVSGRDKVISLPSAEPSRVEIKGKCLEFVRNDGRLPTRIVTAIQLDAGFSGVIPFECSLGVHHFKRPPKRFHWGVIHTTYRSVLLISSYQDFYADQSGADLYINIMTACGRVFKKKFHIPSLENPDPAWLELNELIPSAFRGPGGEFAYITVYSDYGGFQLFTAINKGHSWTLEHTF
jgi:hypothetical protein